MLQYTAQAGPIAACGIAFVAHDSLDARRNVNAVRKTILYD